MNVRRSMGFLHSFSIKKKYDKMFVRLFNFQLPYSESAFKNTCGRRFKVTYSEYYGKDFGNIAH